MDARYSNWDIEEFGEVNSKNYNSCNNHDDNKDKTLDSNIRVGKRNLKRETEDGTETRLAKRDVNEIRNKSGNEVRNEKIETEDVDSNEYEEECDNNRERIEEEDKLENGNEFEYELEEDSNETVKIEGTRVKWEDVNGSRTSSGMIHRNESSKKRMDLIGHVNSHKIKYETEEETVNETKTIPLTTSLTKRSETRLDVRYKAILSIDIGIKNLGYTIVQYPTTNCSLDNIKISFGIENISEKVTKSKTIVASRCESLYKFMMDISTKYDLSKIIIEKQVPTNVKAMELMYAVYGIGMSFVMNPDEDHLILYDPKLKFNSLGVQYDTKNKKHKRQSIGYARNLIEEKFPDLLRSFEKFDKKDDISDSLNQAIIWMSCNGKFGKNGLSELKGIYKI